MAATSFFNATGTQILNGNIDFTNDTLTLLLHTSGNLPVGTDTGALAYGKRVTTGVVGGNVATAGRSVSVVNTDNANCSLPNVTISASGADVTFRGASLISGTPGSGSEISVCYWNFGQDLTITNGGNAVFTFASPFINFILPPSS